jgi:hypothetical protein
MSQLRGFVSQYDPDQSDWSSGKAFKVGIPLTRLVLDHEWIKTLL